MSRGFLPSPFSLPPSFSVTCGTYNVNSADAFFFLGVEYRGSDKIANCKDIAASSAGLSVGDDRRDPRLFRISIGALVKPAQFPKEIVPYRPNAVAFVLTSARLFRGDYYLS